MPEASVCKLQLGWRADHDMDDALPFGFVMELKPRTRAEESCAAERRKFDLNRDSEPHVGKWMPKASGWKPKVHQPL
jgi:hypothetical protein